MQKFAFDFESASSGAWFFRDKRRGDTAPCRVEILADFNVILISSEREENMFRDLISGVYERARREIVRQNGADLIWTPGRPGFTKDVSANFVGDVRLGRAARRYPRQLPESATGPSRQDLQRNWAPGWLGVGGKLITRLTIRCRKFERRVSTMGRRFGAGFGEEIDELSLIMMRT